MNVKTMGLLAGLALCGTAFAQSGMQQGQTQEKQGSSMQKSHKKEMGKVEQGQKELTGKVVGIRQNDVLVQEDNQGAIVSLRVSHDTKLDGKEIKKSQQVGAQLRQELKPGTEVRAAFDPQKMENKAVSIDKK